jgi:hypothetical protein
MKKALKMKVKEMETKLEESQPKKDKDGKNPPPVISQQKEQSRPTLVQKVSPSGLQDEVKKQPAVPHEKETSQKEHKKEPTGSVENGKNPTMEAPENEKSQSTLVVEVNEPSPPLSSPVEENHNSLTIDSDQTEEKRHCPVPEQEEKIEPTVSKVEENSQVHVEPKEEERQSQPPPVTVPEESKGEGEAAVESKEQEEMQVTEEQVHSELPVVPQQEEPQSELIVESNVEVAESAPVTEEQKESSQDPIAHEDKDELIPMTPQETVEIQEESPNQLLLLETSQDEEKSHPPVEELNASLLDDDLLFSAEELNEQALDAVPAPVSVSVPMDVAVDEEIPLIPPANEKREVRKRKKSEPVPATPTTPKEPKANKRQRKQSGANKVSVTEEPSAMEVTEEPITTEEPATTETQSSTQVKAVVNTPLMNALTRPPPHLNHQMKLFVLVSF